MKRIIQAQENSPVINIHNVQSTDIIIAYQGGIPIGICRLNRTKYWELVTSPPYYDSVMFEGSLEEIVKRATGGGISCYVLEPQKL